MITDPLRRMGLAAMGCALTGAITAIHCPVAMAQTVPAEVRQAYSLLGRGLVNDAIRVFQQAIQRYPESIEAKLGLAIAYRRAGRDADAFQTYQQVIQQDPNNQLALKSLGLLGGFRPEWQIVGIDALTRLLALNPNDAEARAQRALLYGYQGRLEESLADYRIVLQQNPTPDVILGAAQVFVYSGDYQQGLLLFNRYMQSPQAKPITGFAAIAYARALRLSGNPGQAVQVLERQRTNKLDDLGIQIQVELSLAYLANQQSAQALAALDALRGKPEAALPLARGLNEIGRQSNSQALLNESAQLYRQVLAQTPNPSPALLREVADVLSSIPSEREYTLQLYRQLSQLDPNDKGIQIKRLALESQLGLVSRVSLRQQVTALLSPLPSDPAQRRAIAQGLVRLSPEAEWLPFYQELLQSEVNEPFLNFRIAQIYIQQNNLTEARNALAVYTATPQGQVDLSPQLLAAEIERREGNLEVAAKRYEAVLALNPVDADVVLGALRGLAGIRLTQGRSAEALQLYDQLVARNPQDMALRLGRASIAYQAKQISEAEAEAVLATWLSSRPAGDAPPELFSLVGALPPKAEREGLYITLVEIDPDYIPVQLRLVQVLAKRDIAQARAQVMRVLARQRSLNPQQDISTVLLQAQLAQAIGDTALAASSYEAVLARQPDNTDALVGLGDIRFQQRQFSAAQTLYNQALAYRPNDLGIRRSLIEVNVAQDFPITALNQLEQIQLQQYAATGSVDPELANRQQKIEEDFLQRRGFQPPWERY
jgi:cellulose synthase operon protein C